MKQTLEDRWSGSHQSAAGLTLEIFGILLGSMVLLFLVMGTVFQVSSLGMRCSLASVAGENTAAVRDRQTSTQTDGLGAVSR